MPSAWTGTRQGTSPGFIDLAGRDLKIGAGSPLRDAGTSSFISPPGCAFPSPLPLASFEPPLHSLVGTGTAASRTAVGPVDIGAFEYGNTGSSPAPAPSQAASLKLYPSRDAHVRNGVYASTNFGSAGLLEVKTDSAESLTRHAYLGFDLTSVASVGSAKLRVYGVLSASDSVSAALYPASSSSWSEETLTWTTRPGHVASSLLGLLSVTSTTPAWRELDVTSYVKSEHAAGRHQLSLVLLGSSPSIEKWSVNSREASSNRPELVISP